MSCANCGRATEPGVTYCVHCAVRCSKCGQMADFLDMKCAKCGSWLPERRSNSPQKTDDGHRKIAAVVVGLSVAVCFYYLAIFDTSGGHGMHNLGLMQDRQLGVLVSSGTGALAVLYLIVRRP